MKASDRDRDSDRTFASRPSLGFELGQVPHTEHRILRADPRLVNLALATPLAGQRVVTGRILTGDQFVSDPDDALRPPVGVESPGAAGHRRNRLCATRRQETVWGARPTRRWCHSAVKQRTGEAWAWAPNREQS